MFPSVYCYYFPNTIHLLEGLSADTAFLFNFTEAMKLYIKCKHTYGFQIHFSYQQECVAIPVPAHIPQAFPNTGPVYISRQSRINCWFLLDWARRFECWVRSCCQGALYIANSRGNVTLHLRGVIT